MPIRDNRSMLRKTAGALCLLMMACEDTRIGSVHGQLQADPAIVDFGRVPVGLVATRKLKLKDIGQGNVVVSAIEPDAASFVTSEWEFGVDESGFTIATNQEKIVSISLRPFVAREEPIESSLIVESDASNTGALEVILRAHVIPSALEIVPNPVEFGSVLAGAAASMDVTITNVADTPVPVLSRSDANGKPEVTTTGLGSFEILTRVTSDGSINAGEDLPPFASLVVQAKYVPDVARPGQDQGRWLVSYCEDPLCEQEVRLRGRGVSSALDCAPPVIDFGAVNPGRTVRRPVTCTNISSSPIFVTDWRMSAGAPPELSVAAVMPRQLGPGEAMAIDTLFAPTLATAIGQTFSAQMSVFSETDQRRALDLITISLTGSCGGPTISVVPARLDFGRVSIGTSSAKRLIVSNLGYGELIIDRIEPDVAMTDGYDAAPRSLRVGAGTSTVVSVTFEPTEVGPFASELVVYSNDSSSPEVHVPLTGEGDDLPPCAYSLNPNPVSFGVVRARTRGQLVLHVQNDGTNECLFNDLEIVDDTNRAFRLVNGAQTGLVVAARDSLDIPIEYAPMGPGTHTAFLTFYVSDPRNSQPRVPLSGVGLATTEVICPPSMVVPAGDPVTLTVQASTQGTAITSYEWSVTSGPTGGAGVAWNPDPPDTESVDFLPYIVGEYSLHVEVTDDLGITASCDFFVTAEGRGLRVALSWDGDGDVDLHLSDSTTEPWFSESGNENDCYYANTSPIWDGAFGIGVGPNPQLDIDNTWSLGPENITVTEPVIGRVYTIGVHNYASAEGRVATIDIFCGGVTAPTGSYLSRPLLGSDGGNCTANDFWKVATVVFTSASTCTISGIDTYVRSDSACVAY